MPFPKARQAILDALRLGPLGPRVLAAVVQQRSPRVVPATVWRELHKLVAAGAVLEDLGPGLACYSLPAVGWPAPPPTHPPRS